MSDEFSIPRQLREANVFVPGVGPLSVFDLAAAGIVAVQSRADVAEAEPEPPSLAPPISADADEPGETDALGAKVDELMQAAETVERRSQMLDMLDERERRLQAFSADTDLIEAALEAGDIQKLSELIGEQ